MKLQQHLLQASLVVLFIGCAVTFACHGKLLASGITKEEKEIILKEHNRLRQMVATGHFPGQPAAENMREIIWDEELAARAQKWADNCQFRHDPFRTINRFTMGQNLAIIWSTAPLDPDDGDFASRIQSWFNEVQKYSFGDAWSLKTGHYSQLVWGETSLVGCGFAEYKDSTKYNKLYVCNYGPGGNVAGYNPYEVGKPACGTYGLQPSLRYRGLCEATSSAETESINNNSIEPYDYQQQQQQQKQADAFSSHTNAYATQFQTQQTAVAAHSRQFLATAARAAAAATTATAKATATASKGFAYGSGKHRYSFSTRTTEAVPNVRGTHRSKFEFYKPTPAEFQSSLRKHTVLRAFLTQEQAAERALHTQTQSQSEQQTQSQAEAVSPPSKAPGTRGWSLLTWRG